VSFPKQFRAMFASTAKEFFADEMPSSKNWRRKASDGKLQHLFGVFCARFLQTIFISRIGFYT